MTSTTSRPLLLGIDTGQTVTKACLFDLDGQEIASSSAPTSTSSPHDRWQERDMHAIWEQTVTVIRDCLARADRAPADVRAVGLCGHNDGLHLVDESLNPVRPAILATDSRAHRYARQDAVGELGDRALRETGQVPFAASPAALLQWIRDHEPENYGRVRWILSCKDWVRLQLTGLVGTDPTDASASFTGVRSQDWAIEALRLYGLEDLSEALPPIVGSGEVAGEISARAAAATGLNAGTPVVAGAHDVDANALGIGCSRPGDLSIVMGTFSINQVIEDTPRLDRRWQARAFVRSGQWMHMSSSPSSASNLEWVIRNFGPWREGDLPDHARAMEEAFAAAAQPQHRPQPVYLPFLYGSPHGDAMPATLTGLRGWHTRGDVLHAVLKGVVFNHRTHVDALREQFDLSSGARVCGGGARSPKWTQLLADSRNSPVEVTDVDQAGARGAALLAGVGTGHYRDLNHAIAQTVRVVRRHEPHAPTARVLEVEYARYLDLVHALMPLFNDDPAATRHYLKEPLCH